MSTTLEAELLQAAEAWEILAENVEAVGDDELAEDRRGKAERARQRAAWVRELEAVKLPLATAPTLGSEWHTLGQQDMWVKVTGPIPAAETAPTERKET